MIAYRKTIATPVGPLILAATEKTVAALLWNESDLERLDLRFAAGGASCPLLALAEKQLDEYFQGGRKSFRLPLAPAGTPFQQRVWGELAKIPYGATWSYRELADRIGNPGAMRAVGTANGRNPLCIFIPCHRVIRASGESGGYAGGTGNKALLLELERAKPV